MIYQEFAPAPQVANAVASYWRFALPSSHQPATTQHAVPPDGAVNLCWLPPGWSALVGPRVSALRVPVQAGAEYIGIRFLPGAAGPLLGINVRSVREAVNAFPKPDFEAVMRSRALAGLDELVSKWAVDIAWQGPDPAVSELTRRIVDSDGKAAVADLLQGLNLSYRQILRRFHEASGLTPKEFARLRRFRAACLQAVRTSDPQWAAVSVDGGFSDQSH